MHNSERKSKVYTESVNLLHLPSTPGGKIKQHSVRNELPSGAILIDENVNGINLPERMVQPVNETEGMKSDNGEVTDNNAMEKDNDNNSINSDYLIEFITINPRAFTFQRMTMSPMEAATIKLSGVEG